MCAYILVHTYIHACKHTNIQTCKPTYFFDRSSTHHASTSGFVPPYADIYVYIYTHTDIHMHIHTHIHTHTHMYTHTHSLSYTQMHIHTIILTCCFDRSSTRHASMSGFASQDAVPFVNGDLTKTLCAYPVCVCEDMHVYV